MQIWNHLFSMVPNLRYLGMPNFTTSKTKYNISMLVKIYFIIMTKRKGNEKYMKSMIQARYVEQVSMTNMFSHTTHILSINKAVES